MKARPIVLAVVAAAAVLAPSAAMVVGWGVTDGTGPINEERRLDGTGYQHHGPAAAALEGITLARPLLGR